MTVLIVSSASEAVNFMLFSFTSQRMLLRIGSAFVLLITFESIVTALSIADDDTTILIVLVIC
jgi:hypothetical protein